MATAVSPNPNHVCQETVFYTFVLAAANPVPTHAGFAGVLFAVFFNHVVGGVRSGESVDSRRSRQMSWQVMLMLVLRTRVLMDEGWRSV